MATESSYRWELHPIAEFGKQREEWDRLNQRGPRSPVLTAMFVAPLLKEFGAVARSRSADNRTWWRRQFCGGGLRGLGDISATGSFGSMDS